MPVDDAEESPGGLPVVARRAEEGFGIALDRREGRTKLVRDVRHEVPANDLQAAELGDVVEHEDEAERPIVGRAEPRAVDLQDEAAARVERDVA